jgi:hypothetical protein
MTVEGKLMGLDVIVITGIMNDTANPKSRNARFSWALFVFLNKIK